MVQNCLKLARSQSKEILLASRTRRITCDKCFAADFLLISDNLRGSEMSRIIITMYIRMPSSRTDSSGRAFFLEERIKGKVEIIVTPYDKELN